MIHGHGGDIYALARELGCDPYEIADMSSNINPLGPPPALMQHLEANLNRIKALPEADAGQMLTRFADSCGLDTNEVLAGNGTTQIIYDLPRALGMREALIVGPTYADYADGCRQYGVRCRSWLTRPGDDFRVDPDALREALPAADAVYLCNPNNPTGQLLEGDTIRTLCRDFPRKTFIIDESYLPFVPRHEDHSLIRRRPANALVLHSMSKIFRIPGLRVGFVIGNAERITRLRQLARPWSVNSLAQSAVGFLLANESLSQAFILETQDYVRDEREALMAELRTIAGLRIFPSQASFFLLQLPATHRANDVCRHLRAARILIRDCTNFDGLSGQFIRISVKSPDVNRKCAELLRTYLRT